MLVLLYLHMFLPFKGGSFGGKQTRCTLAAVPAAIAAVK